MTGHYKVYIDLFIDSIAQAGSFGVSSHSSMSLLYVGSLGSNSKVCFIILSLLTNIGTSSGPFDEPTITQVLG